MHIPGHLAVAVIQHRVLARGQRSESQLKLLLLAALFPDVVDKTVGYIFHLMPNGRHYAHNIFSLLGVSWLVGRVWGWAVGWVWFAGYLGHMLADAGHMIPWFFPLKSYPFTSKRLRFPLRRMVIESLFLTLALLWPKKPGP